LTVKVKPSKGIRSSSAIIGNNRRQRIKKTRARFLSTGDRSAEIPANSATAAIVGRLDSWRVTDAVRFRAPSRIERLFRIIFPARVHATLDSGHSLAVLYDGDRDCDSDSADNRHDRNENRENLRTKYLIDQRFVSEQN
jgi:hypothetical protein